MQAHRTPGAIVSALAVAAVSAAAFGAVLASRDAAPDAFVGPRVSGPPAELLRVSVVRAPALQPVTAQAPSP